MGRHNRDGLDGVRGTGKSPVVTLRLDERRRALIEKMCGRDARSEFIRRLIDEEARRRGLVNDSQKRSKIQPRTSGGTGSAQNEK